MAEKSYQKIFFPKGGRLKLQQMKQHLGFPKQNLWVFLGFCSLKPSDFHPAEATGWTLLDSGSLGFGPSTNRTWRPAA